MNDEVMQKTCARRHESVTFSRRSFANYIGRLPKCINENETAVNTVIVLERVMTHAATFCRVAFVHTQRKIKSNLK